MHAHDLTFTILLHRNRIWYSYRRHADEHLSDWAHHELPNRYVQYHRFLSKHSRHPFSQSDSKDGLSLSLPVPGLHRRGLPAPQSHTLYTPISTVRPTESVQPIRILSNMLYLHIFSSSLGWSQKK